MASQPIETKRAVPAAPTAHSGSPVLAVLRTAAVATAILGTVYQAGQLLGFSASSLPRPSFLQPQAAPFPSQAQVIDQRSFNALPHVLPSTEFNGTSKVCPSPFLRPSVPLLLLLCAPFLKTTC